jgi:ribonuclease-3
VTRLTTERLDAAAINLGELDEKSRLQEMVASAGMGPPVYEVRSEGPDHAQRFFATVVVDGEVLGEGEGTSKKAAERVAAAEACERVTLTATPSQSPSASPTF